MKIIGIVGRAYYNKDNQKIIQLNDFLRQAMCNYDEVVPILLLPTLKENYVETKMGEDKILEIDKVKLNHVLDKCSGFIIPGGSSWYNFDNYVIEYALKNNKPLLGICAGFQAICSIFATNKIHFDMTQKLENNNHYGDENEYIHSITIKGNTLLKKIIAKDSILVNSLHHDYINIPMKDLIISATSDDGVIEAVELPNHTFFLGIQWHPEYLMDEDSKKIFSAFCKKVIDNDNIN